MSMLDYGDDMMIMISDNGGVTFIDLKPFGSLFFVLVLLACFHIADYSCNLINSFTPSVWQQKCKLSNINGKTLKQKIDLSNFNEAL